MIGPWINQNTNNVFVWLEEFDFSIKLREAQAYIVIVLKDFENDV